MIVEERKKRLLDIIRKNKFVSLQELKRATQTSLSTVRRDLVDLAADGVVRRVHGGVEFMAHDRDHMTVHERRTIYQADKQRIAKRAAAELKGGEMLFLDAGTTTGELIPYLAGKKPAVTVVTNSVHHAAKLSDLMIPVMIIGGQVKQTTDAVIGAAAVNQINHMVFQTSFIGTDGLSIAFGLTTPDLEEAAIKKAVVERSQISYVLADASKIETASFAKAVDLTQVTLITTQLTSDQSHALHEAMTVIEAEEPL